MRWSQVAWEAHRLTVFSPKTEHHHGRESRVIPLFLEIEAELVNHLAEAEDGAEFVFPELTKKSNLRSGLERIIERAGVKQWPKLWQNLRASGSADLARELPGHVAAAICGHTEQVAMEHYWQVSESDFELAINERRSRKAKQYGAVQSGMETNGESVVLKSLGKSDIPCKPKDIQWAILDSKPMLAHRENQFLSKGEAESEAVTPALPSVAAPCPSSDADSFGAQTFSDQPEMTAIVRLALALSVEQRLQWLDLGAKLLQR